MESVSRISKGKWQSKFNSDPLSKTEESQWEFYSPEQNYLLEKAYYEKKNEADLGDSIVSIQDMRLNSKGNALNQRSIRRIAWEDNEMDIRSERYFDTELPKTLNKIFGSLQHFITFFSRRNPEILHFTKQFNEFEQSNDLNELNRNILPQLLSCLEEELLKPIEEHLKNNSLSEKEKETLVKRKARHGELISLFQKDFESFEEFYGLILRAYTMSTDLYLNLNKYLRNENWIGMDTLLPYALCLCKAFFSFTHSKKLWEKQGSVTLFRGTAFNELALSCYMDEASSKVFSWNSVTSTSTSRKIAENFMYESVDLEKNKYPVLFIIEIPLAELKGFNWINIHKYSDFPNEYEIILAPGSVFELVNFSTDEEKRTIIQLKLRHEVESLAHQGLIMQGAFQNEMMSDKQVKIMCLEGEELYEALKSVSGNRLIEEIELCLCIFDQRSLEEMLLILPTLEKAKGLKLISCKYEDDQEISSVKLTGSTNISQVEISEVQDLFKILSLSYFWGSLRAVKIDFRNLEFDSCELQFFKSLTRLTSLTLSFSDCLNLFDEGVKRLTSQTLKHLTQLTSLSLSFSHCQEITDEGMSHLATQGLSNLSQLTSLTLDFSHCGELTDEGVNNLASQALKCLIQLTSLTLNFSFCQEITNEGVNNLASQGLKSLTQLTSLNLDFSWCHQITVEGVKNLVYQGLKYLTELISLAMNFSSRQEITEEEIDNFVSQALKYLTLLTSFIFNNREMKQTDQNYQIEEDEYQKSQLRLNLIRPKTHNQPIFSRDDSALSSENINSATSSELIEKIEKTLNNYFLELMDPQCKPTIKLPISSLQVLFQADSLPFECHQIKDNLTSKASKYLAQLTSLSLDFPQCDQITKEGLHNLASQGLQSLHQLTSLTLNFSSCHKITNEGVKILAFEGLKSLVQLTSLTLDFSDCSKLTDEGVNYLASQGLQSLTQLTSLTLDLYRNGQITDEGLNNLSIQGLKYLTQLISLKLNFYCCEKITDYGIKILAFQGLENLTELTSLALDFSHCREITDEGMNHLASTGLKYLNPLTSLLLRFSNCRITDKGVNDLIYHTIKYSIQLTSLTLDFSACKIPKFTALSIAKVLHYSGFIQNKDQTKECN